MRKRRLYSSTLPQRVRNKYAKDVKTIPTDLLLLELEKFLEKEERQKEIFDILSSKERTRKLFENTAKNIHTQEEKARFSALSKMSKVSLKDYIIMDGKQISTLALDQISILNDEAWERKGL